MRHAVSFIVLLVVCLTFAPARFVTGDRTAYPQSSPPAPDAAAPPPSDVPFADLCRDDPLAALARSLYRYRTEVEGYSCTFIKRERLDGKLRAREVIKCDFRESPFAVRMEWLEGGGRAAIMLYPAGDRADQMAVVPSNKSVRAVIPYALKSVNDPTVRAQARSPVTEFGLYLGTFRAQTAWQASKEAGTLRTEYRGLKPVPELDNKLCHVLHRDMVIPEEDGQTTVTMFFDPDTLQQAGAILTAGEDLLASYYFKDVVLNPKFAADHFAVPKLK